MAHHLKHASIEGIGENRHTQTKKQTGVTFTNYRQNLQLYIQRQKHNKITKTQ